MKARQDALSGERQLTAGGGFWPLWQEHRAYVRGVCHRVLGRPDDVDDALSETMLRAWRHLENQTAPIENPRAWLAQIAHHVCIDALRRGSRLVLSSDAVADDEAETAPLAGAAHAAEDPESVVVEREALRQLVGKVRLLPPRLRDPVVLHAFHEMPYSEVASYLGISVPNARKRVQIARQMLAGPEPPSRRSAPASGTDPVDLPLPNPALHPPIRIPASGIDTRVVRVPVVSGAVLEFRVSSEGLPARGESRVATLRRYVERFPRGWKKRLELADLLLAQGAWHEASEEYRMVLVRRPELLEVWLRLGHAQRLLGNRAEAAAAYESALPHARHPAARRYIEANAALSRGDHLSAVAGFDAAAALDPESPCYRHALASVHNETGRPVEALRAYGDALRLNMDDAVALVGSSEALLSCGHQNEAERRLARACELQPECLSALTLLAHRRCTRRLVTGSEGQQTRQTIRRALKVAPAAASVWDALAHFYVARGEDEKARMVLKEFAERHPDGPGAWYHYAIWLFHTGHYGAAADAILRAWEMHPGDAQVGRCICAVLPYAGRMEEMESAIAVMLQGSPERWDILIAAGLALSAWLDQFDRACYLSGRAVELQPELGAAWVQHGEILAAAGQFDEAIDALERGWELLPRDDGHSHAVAAAFWLARTHGMLGDERPSRRWHEQMAARAREWILQDPAAGYYALGQALDALGDRAGAAGAYRGALRLHLPYPEREMAQDAAARLLRVPRPVHQAK